MDTTFALCVTPWAIRDQVGMAFATLLGKVTVGAVGRDVVDMLIDGT